MTPLLSVVIPVHNEAGCVEPLVRELPAPLDATGLAWEVLWIDDGSTDGTAAELASLLKRYPQAASGAAVSSSIRVLRLERRYGQSTALWTGLKAACGQTIVTLDGDGQNDPADIPRLVQALEGADMIVGHRVKRQDNLSKRVFARLANSLRNWLTDSHLPDSGCGLKAFRREVIGCFLPMEGLHRFLPTMAEMAGYRVQSIPVHHRPRQRGKSKYGVSDRLIGPLLDCLMLCRLKRRRLAEPVWHEIGSRSTGFASALAAPELNTLKATAGTSTPDGAGGTGGVRSPLR